MIYSEGFLLPTAAQVRLVREHADGSFCRTVPQSFDFMNVPPLPEGYAFDSETFTALKLKNVEPHNDTWVGGLPAGVDTSGWEDGPPSRRAVFWIIDMARHSHLHIQCGAFSSRMRKGSWVLFDDSVLHCVVSDRTWYGLACQVALKHELP
jgi:hypothetical protein